MTNAAKTYDNQAVGYQTINLVGGNSQYDGAILAASPVGNDAIYAQGDTLDMTYPLGDVDLNDIATVLATSTGGGTDTISRNLTDIALTTSGPWTTVK